MFVIVDVVVETVVRAKAELIHKAQYWSWLIRLKRNPLLISWDNSLYLYLNLPLVIWCGTKLFSLYRHQIGLTWVLSQIQDTNPIMSILTCIQSAEQSGDSTYYDINTFKNNQLHTVITSQLCKVHVFTPTLSLNIGIDRWSHHHHCNVRVCAHLNLNNGLDLVVILYNYALYLGPNYGTIHRTRAPKHVVKFRLAMHHTAIITRNTR